MSDIIASNIWLSWLITVAVITGAIELLLLLWGLRKARNTYEWTLSDTIRRWVAEKRYIPGIVMGSVVWLMWHLFFVSN